MAVGMITLIAGIAAGGGAASAAQRGPHAAGYVTGPPVHDHCPEVTAAAR